MARRRAVRRSAGASRPTAAHTSRAASNDGPRRCSSSTRALTPRIPRSRPPRDFHIVKNHSARSHRESLAFRRAAVAAISRGRSRWRCSTAGSRGRTGRSRADRRGSRQLNASTPPGRKAAAAFASRTGRFSAMPGRRRRYRTVSLLKIPKAFEKPGDFSYPAALSPACSIHLGTGVLARLSVSHLLGFRARSHPAPPPSGRPSSPDEATRLMEAEGLEEIPLVVAPYDQGLYGLLTRSSIRNR